MDTDILFAANVEELFELLERFDFIAAHDVWRFGRDVGVPESVPEFNCGVMGFRDSSPWQELQRDWESLLLKQRETGGELLDQACLREAFYRSSVRPYVLTSEYNFRLIYPNLVGNLAKVKIIHGRHHRWRELVELINRSNHPRLWAGSFRALLQFAVVSQPRGQRLLQWIRRLLRIESNA